MYRERATKSKRWKDQPHVDVELKLGTIQILHGTGSEETNLKSFKKHNIITRSSLIFELDLI